MEQAVAIYCGPDSCRDISRNAMIDGSMSPGETIGIWLDQSGPTVDRNFISGGCGPVSAIGVDLTSSYARLTNNVITPCVPNAGGLPSLSQAYGIRQMSTIAGDEPEIHSNTIDGGRAPVTCTGRAVQIMAGTGAGARGVYRNNIFHAGLCSTRYAFQELTPDADPRIVENNDFWNGTAGQYFDEGTTAQNTAAAIDGMTDIIVGGNLVTDPLFVSTFADVHLQAGSLCIDAGTATGAPGTDMEGNTRPRAAGYDIGADER